MDLSTFLYFLVASVLLTIAPGPDIMYLLAKSLADGARSGIALAFGLCTGLIFHTTLVIIGVAAVIQQSPTAFAVLKYAGAAYLLYLAWGAFHAQGDLKLNTVNKSASYFKLYRRGVIMNVLNPKVLLFFLAFLPQFVNLNSDSVSLQIAFLGFIFGLQTLIVFSLVAVCAGKVRDYILNIKNFNKIMGYVQGIVLIGISLALIIS
ncbi:LysE family translocator [Megamonas hypermegale]|uniref:LysE family translocator n=1 Tax=Megamonas hypermegale TaxID=158847 RepID=A0A921HMP6_9FIRM|nr:LysE family translocator [Megamonas hypermegale]MDM8143785.1 LysE family translocator [Megamonas hypermegale]HJF84138.1 LysE family translocator [Megamonas hypermegale]